MATSSKENTTAKSSIAKQARSLFDRGLITDSLDLLRVKASELSENAQSSAEMKDGSHIELL